MTKTQTTTETLRASILALATALDPQHQGEQWPDPIAWDGRAIVVQARDLLALADDSQDEAVIAAAKALRAAHIAVIAAAEER